MATASNPTDEEVHLPGSLMYLHAATIGAGQAINWWLRQIERGPTYRFETGGVECSLSFSTEPGPEIPLYARAEGGRWRWGRLENGDPDEDETGEDILLDVALDRPLVRGRQGRRHRASFPPFAEGSLTRAEIEAHAANRATANLEKLVLREWAEVYAQPDVMSRSISDVTRGQKPQAQ